MTLWPKKLTTFPLQCRRMLCAYTTFVVVVVVVVTMSIGGRVSGLQASLEAEQRGGSPVALRPTLL